MTRLRTGTLMAWYRYCTEVGLVLPAARWLPRRAGYAIGMGLGLVDSCTGMGRLARRQLAATHGLQGWALRAGSWRWCATPYIDLLHLNRCARGAADVPSVSGARIKVPDEVVDHVRAGRALVVVGGHFPFAPSMAAVEALRRIRSEAGHDGPVVVIVGERALGTNGGTRRDQLRSDAFHNAFPSRPGVPEVQVVEVARSRMWSTGRSLLSAIRQPGALCFVALDRPWDSASAHRRPFAGWRDLALSTNAARLAIAGGAGMVSITPVRVGRGISELSWGILRHATPGESPTVLTDRCADEIEAAIGRAPMDYQLGTGTARVWDAVAGRWRSRFAEAPLPTSEAHSSTHREPAVS